MGFSDEGWGLRVEVFGGVGGKRVELVQPWIALYNYTVYF